MSDSTKFINIDSFQLKALGEFGQYLSPDRLNRYLKKTGNDKELALNLYAWNVAISGAFYGPLQILEVVLRNSFHNVLSNYYDLNWYENPKIVFNERDKNKLKVTKRRLVDNNYSVIPPNVVASLSFGFWTSLLSTGGKEEYVDYKKHLWNPALCRAFPNLENVERSKVQQAVWNAQKLRNRIAHHEPIFKRHLQKDYENILKVIGWISPEIKEWVAAYSQVPQLLAMQGENKNLLPDAKLSYF